MKRTMILMLAACAALSGCGKKAVLRPADGAALPPKAETAAAQPGVGDLLAVPTQAKPARQDELVTKSTPLQPDRFDLPPPG